MYYRWNWPALETLKRIVISLHLTVSSGRFLSFLASTHRHWLFDGGKEQTWSAALPVKTNRFMIYYRIRECHNQKLSLWHIKKKNTKKKKKHIGQRVKLAARPPRNVPVLLMASPRLDAVLDEVETQCWSELNCLWTQSCRVKAGYRCISLFLSGY